MVWPRTDRVVREDLVGAGNDRSTPSTSTHPATGPRGEFRSLREYRPGDDARDIHWRTSARLRQPVIREYEREAAEATWIVLEVGDPPSDEAEAAVEVAASLCARAARWGQPFALFAGSRAVGPGTGEAHLERALDVLARVDFGGEGTSYPHESRDRAVLVTPGRILPGFPQVIRTATAGVREEMPERHSPRGPGGGPA